MNEPLTHKQQTLRVVLLGVTFLIMFTAFNSLQNAVGNIYADQGFGDLGKWSLLVLYFVFALCTFFTPFVIRKFGYKLVMFVSCLGYALYEVAGLIVVLWQDIPPALGWVFVMIGAITCGASASAIWVAQGSYVSVVAGQDRKTELFGLFWMLMMSSQIFGNVITTFVLGIIGKVAYFAVLTALGTGSAFLFFLLPNVNAIEVGEQLTLKGQVLKVWNVMKDRKYIHLTIYYYFPGITIGFYTTFASSLIRASLPQQQGETDPDYNDRMNQMGGYAFIALGVTQACTGFIMNRFFEPFCKFKLAIIGTAVVQTAAFASMLCYFLESYGLSIAVTCLWGMCETYLMTNTGALIGKVYPGKVEAFSVFRVFFALGSVTTFLLNILLAPPIPGWVFLAIIVAAQILTIGISSQIMDLKNMEETSLTKEDSAGQLTN